MLVSAPVAVTITVPVITFIAPPSEAFSIEPDVPETPTGVGVATTVSEIPLVAPSLVNAVRPSGNPGVSDRVISGSTAVLLGPTMDPLVPILVTEATISGPSDAIPVASGPVTRVTDTALVPVASGVPILVPVPGTSLGVSAPNGTSRPPVLGNPIGVSIPGIALFIPSPGTALCIWEPGTTLFVFSPTAVSVADTSRAAALVSPAGSADVPVDAGPGGTPAATEVPGIFVPCGVGSTLGVPTDITTGSTAGATRGVTNGSAGVMVDPAAGDTAEATPGITPGDMTVPTAASEVCAVCASSPGAIPDAAAIGDICSV